MRLTLRILVGGALCAVLSHCGLSKDATESVSLACVDSHEDTVATFQKGLHPLLVQSCNSCHVEGQRPEQFASMSSVNRAYTDAKKYSSFKIPEESILVRKMKESHNCGGQCAKLAKDFTVAIEAWKKVEENAVLPLCTTGEPEQKKGPEDSPEKRFISSTKRMSSSLSSTETAIVWDLGRENPAFVGAYIRIMVRRDIAATSSSLGTFAVGKVSLGSNSKRFRIRNIGFRVNGVTGNYMNYDRVDFVVAPQNFDLATWPFFNVSRFEQAIAFEKAEGDDLQLLFTLEETTQNPSPDPGTPETEVQLFNRTIGGTGGVLPTRCVGCHGGNNAGATAVFNLTGANIATFRTNAITEIGAVTDAPNTNLLLNARGLSGNGHPYNLSTSDSAGYQALLTWVQRRISNPSP